MIEKHPFLYETGVLIFIRKVPIFYLYNEVKVIDITPLIQQAKEEAAEKAMKEAANQN